MAALLVSLPLQIACQIMCGTNSTNNNLNCFDNTPSFQQHAPLSKGYVAFPDIGRAFKSYHDKEVTWDEARRRCIENGANLAVIDSLTTQDYIMKVKPAMSSAHVGIHRFFNGEEWTSVKNDPLVSSLPWAPYEPTYGADENCAFMWMDGRGLAAGNCYKNIQHFICEIPI
ncbi:C-type lectin domain family 17, member A isoform X4 [Neodiprion lecontei]|uniref:C-type lectin domain family 17, member A isoform X4 n=1 Tax=Neodiprion lecontei TaxID=441921 RepID=A0ABM3GNA4_NEOLC|nr:C-type lectin domain family 17, member A isoform X4 [Neodiprion lecontei]